MWCKDHLNGRLLEVNERLSAANVRLSVEGTPFCNRNLITGVTAFRPFDN